LIFCGRVLIKFAVLVKAVSAPPGPFGGSESLLVEKCRICVCGYGVIVCFVEDIKENPYEEFDINVELRMVLVDVIGVLKSTK
jgi:hypothetical protein